jgi:hypothetical protein
LIRTIRNILGGLLAGYGFAAFICSMVVLQVWEMNAPRQPDEALGLIYLHQEKSVSMYFSRHCGQT